MGYIGVYNPFTNHLLIADIQVLISAGYSAPAAPAAPSSLRWP